MEARRAGLTAGLKFTSKLGQMNSLSATLCKIWLVSTSSLFHVTMVFPCKVQSLQVFPANSQIYQGKSFRSLLWRACR